MQTPDSLSRDQLAGYLRRIYLEDWKYAPEDAQYYKRIRAGAEALAEHLREFARRSIYTEWPANYTNCYRICVPLRKKLPANRLDIRRITQFRPEPVVYLEVLVAVVLPVVELSYYTYQADAQRPGEIEIITGDLREPPESLRAAPITHELQAIAREHGLAMIPRELGAIPADPDLPAELCLWKSELQLRDFLFLNGAF